MSTNLSFPTISLSDHIWPKRIRHQRRRILDRFAFHATGKPHMSPLGKIIYCADKIDPLRGFNSRPLIKKCYQNYYLGFVVVLSANREYILANGKDIYNPLTDACMQLYLGKGKDIEFR
jgi:nicotinate-nucleotide adenylyltransferase